jgi:MFS family permease
VWKIVAVASFGSLLAQLDAMIVNVALSSLAADLHVSFSIIQWVTSGYLLALATTSLNISQRLGGHYNNALRDIPRLEARVAWL